jgi:hypothetical protein
METRKTPKIKMTANPTNAALGRAILSLESEAGKMHIEASLARSNGDEEHARFFLSRESQAREDFKLLSELMESTIVQSTDLLGDQVEKKHGSIPLLKIAVSALHKLLVSKGIVTEAELNKSFAEMTEIAEENSLHNSKLSQRDCE